VLLREIARGLKVGMVLQLAVGPVFAFVLNVALVADVPAFLGAVLGVTLVDAFYIGLASLGVSRFLEGAGRKRALNMLSAAVLMFFGLYILYGAREVWLSGESGLQTLTGMTGIRPFLYAVALTVSSPLTIVFWTGVFAGYSTEAGEGRRAFAAGCVLATFLFLASTGIFARYFAGLLSPAAIAMLNALAGLVLLCYGAKKALQSLQR